MERRTSHTLIALWAVAVLAASTSSTSMTLETYRYFANLTNTWRQFVCSEAERQCFKKQQLLHEADGQCYPAGARGPCADGEIFHADKPEAARKGGHMRGSCSSRCADPSQRPVAATGECLTRAQVAEQICRGDWYLRPAMDVFGEWVCEWTTLPCPPRGGASFGAYEPQYDGTCTAPDIFNVISDGSNATVPAEKPADHPMLKYFTNKTYLEREFPCTEEEKLCLQYGRMLQSDGKCYVPGQWSNRCEPGQILHIDWDEMATNGRLVGSCRSRCGVFKYPQIVSGACADYSTMNNICRWDWGLNTEQNVFGQMACSCAWDPSTPRPPPPSPPPPAATPGHCRVPDFSNPVSSPVYDQTLTLGFQVSCTEEEFACLHEGRVLVAGACHALRTRGPCADGEELVLDKHDLAHARVKAVCKTLPCPEGSVLLPYNGQCLTNEQVLSILCVGQKVSLDEFGGWQCDYEGRFPGNLTRITRNADEGSCELPEKYPSFVPAAGGGAAFASTGPSSAGRPGGGFAAAGAPAPGGPGGFGGGAIRPQYSQG